jgi:hypothetical protein
MKLFQVPQRRIRVRLRLSDGRELDGTLFVPESGPGGGPGRLIDRLNDAAEWFLPLLGADGQQVIAKRSLVTILCEAGDEPAAAGDVAADHACQVRLRLAGGAVIGGWLRYGAPPERSRVLDYLNTAPSFLRIEAETGLTYVARAAIVSVEELDREIG